MASQILRTRKRQLKSKNLANSEHNAIKFNKASALTYIRLVRYQPSLWILQINLNKNNQFSLLNQISQPSLWILKISHFSLLNKIRNPNKHIVNFLKMESATGLNVTRPIYFKELASIR